MGGGGGGRQKKATLYMYGGVLSFIRSKRTKKIMCSNSLYSDVFCGRWTWTTVVPWCWTPSSRSRTRWTPAWHSGGAVGRVSVDHVPWILVRIVLICSGPRHGGEMARKKVQEFYGFYFFPALKLLELVLVLPYPISVQVLGMEQFSIFLLVLGLF